MAKKKGTMPKLVRSPIIECGGYFFAIAPLMMEVMVREGLIRRKQEGAHIYSFT